jgi:hypothetical protein
MRLNQQSRHQRSIRMLMSWRRLFRGHATASRCDETSYIHDETPKQFVSDVLRRSHEFSDSMIRKLIYRKYVASYIRTKAEDTNQLACRSSSATRSRLPETTVFAALDPIFLRSDTYRYNSTHTKIILRSIFFSLGTMGKTRNEKP